MVSNILSSRSHFFSTFFLLCHLVWYSLLLDWFLSWQLNCLILIGTPRLSYPRLVSSSLSQWSAFLLIIFPNSFNIFITSFLNWGSSRLVSSVSFFVHFSCCFHWEQFLCFSILLNFLCLCEFRRKSYLLWSWRVGFMWEYPCVDCVNPVSLVQGRVWMCMPAMSFLIVLAVILSVGVTTKSLARCRGRAPSLLRDCHQLVGRQGLLPSCCSRSPKFNQAPSPLSICLLLKEVTTEVKSGLHSHSEPIHRSSPRSSPFLCCLHPRPSARLWCDGAGGSGTEAPCCQWGPGMPLWQTFPRMCPPQIQHQATV